MNKKQVLATLALSTIALAQAGFVSADELAPIDSSTPTTEVVTPTTPSASTETEAPAVQPTEPSVTPVDPTAPSGKDNAGSLDGVPADKPAPSDKPQDKDNAGSLDGVPTPSDKPQDKAFTVDHSKIKMTAAGKDVKNMFDMYHVLSDKGRTDAINKILKELNLNPKGEFYLWVAKDSKSFYQNYVKPNKNVTVDLPAKLLVKAGEIVKNDFKQIDFGNSYQSNLVTVEVPNVKPEKHALDRTGKKVLDGKEVQLGDYIQYFLNGVTVPEKHDTLYQYDGLDKLDTKHDRYTGNWKGIIKGTEYTAEKELVLPYDVTLKNGKVIKAGDKIAKGSTYAFTFEFNQGTNSEFIKKLVTIKWNEKTGVWSYVINQDFLNSLGVKGTFDADFYIEVERIAAGEVENTFVNIVNGQEMIAKVTTRTPEPPKPEPKEPGKPQPQPSLPNTGTAASMLPVVGMILGLLSLAGLRKSKEN